MSPLTPEETRHIMVLAQGVQPRSAKTVTREDLMTAIRRMGLLQIDTISVVARSPYLVLWSRLGEYPLVWLEELLAEGHLFEYWSHAACFLPREDFPIYRRSMLEYAERMNTQESVAGRWWEGIPDSESREVIERVLNSVRQNGAKRSAHFEREEASNAGWWNWKPEKLALERLFYAGTLMIARRDGFQRVYDLQERVAPAWTDAHALTREAGTREMILKAVKALGVAQAKWVSSYFPDYLRRSGSKQVITRLLNELAAEGELFPVQAEGWKEPAYTHPEHQAMIQNVREEGLRSNITTLLSPFDPLVSDRERALSVFGFSYRIEVYTPAAKRQFGYFTLPILHNGELIGRLDAKAHRKDGLLEVRKLHLEAEVKPSARLAKALAETLIDFAQWHKTPEIVTRHSDPPEFLAMLDAALKRDSL